MPTCRKCCGQTRREKKEGITVHHCKHCGYQPGPKQLDRSGKPRERVDKNG